MDATVPTKRLFWGGCRAFQKVCGNIVRQSLLLAALFQMNNFCFEGLGELVSTWAFLSLCVVPLPFQDLLLPWWYEQGGIPFGFTFTPLLFLLFRDQLAIRDSLKGKVCIGATVSGQRI